MTTVAFGSVRATYGPLSAPVWESSPPDRARVGMSLRVTSRIEGAAAGTFQTLQSGRRKASCGAWACTERGNVGKASWPPLSAWAWVSYGVHSLQKTP